MSDSEPSKESSKKSAAQDKKDGPDLTTILDKSQRADLTLLIANATEAMRKLILDNFNASAGLDDGLLREDMTDEEKLAAAGDPATADVTKFDRERKLKEQFEKELDTLKMKNLKKNSLKAYDEWREEVLQRVGQVVNSEEVAMGQLHKDAKADSSRPQAPDTNTIGKIVSVPNGSILKFKDLFPPTKTPLTKLPMNKRTLVLHSLLLLLLSLEHYNAPSRILLLNVTSSFKLPLKTFEADEATTAQGLLEAAKELSADEETKKMAEENKDSRKWKVGLATAAGAAILGVSGGMAAPLIAAGVGSVMGGLGLGATAAAGYLGTVAGSTVLVGGLFGAYGGRMTGQMMDNYAREVEDFAFLPVHSRNKTSEDEKEGAQQATEHDHRLRVTVCISGWLTEKDEVVKPWKVIGKGAEVFALKYELEALLNLGHAMDGMVQSAAWGYAQKQLIAQTVFADLMAAMWPIGLMKVSRVIDNPFSVAKGRADKAGLVLADALINRAQGERPVTLIGYSLGARVIYTCLMTLAKRKAFGLLENVVLIGAPTPADSTYWRTMRSVVSGRLVNVYSENDYVLGFMYRTSSIQYGVAGLQKVEGLAGVENVNVSEDVSGHTRYRYLIGSILKKIGFEDIDMQAVEEERETLKKVEAEEKKNSLQAQKNRLLRRQSVQGGKEDEAAEAEHEASELEKQVQANTQKSLMTRAVEYFYMPHVPNAKDVEKQAEIIQKVANDPKDAANVALSAAQDVKANTESYAQWAAKKLPSLPSMGSKTTAPTDVDKVIADPGKAAKDLKKTAADPTKATGDVKKVAADPTKAAGDAMKTVSDATKDLPVKAPAQAPSVEDVKKAAADPTKAASDAAKAVSAATKDLPTKVPEQAPSVDGVKKAATDTAEAAKGYTSYLPSLPSLGRGKAKPAPKEASNDATKKAADTSKAAADTAAKAPTKATESVKTVADPAVKNAASTATSIPDAVANKGADAAEAAGAPEGVSAAITKPTEAVKTVVDPTAKNATATATSITDAAGQKGTEGAKTVTDTASKASDAAKAATDTAKKAPIISQAADKVPSLPDLKKKATPEAKPEAKSSYTSYLPSLPKFGLSNAAPKAPATPKKDSAKETTEEAPKKPSTPSRSPSEVKKAPPKLDRLPSGVKSPIAPTKLSRSASILKSPTLPTKLDQLPSLDKLPSVEGLPSAVKSPAPKLEKLPSGIKSPPAKLPKTPSGIKSPAPKLDSLGSKLNDAKDTVGGTLPTAIKSPLGGLGGGSEKEKASEKPKTPSGAKSPPPKLPRSPSGIKSPAPKLDSIDSKLNNAKETVGATLPTAIKSPLGGLGGGSDKEEAPEKPKTPSGAKSPPPKLPRSPSEVKSPAPQLDSIDSKLNEAKDSVGGTLPAAIKSPLGGGLGGLVGGKKQEKAPEKTETPSGAKSPAPSGIKSPAPKLPKTPAASGVKSRAPPKLPKTPKTPASGGAKPPAPSPAAKKPPLTKTPSGITSPASAPKLERIPSGLQSPAPTPKPKAKATPKPKPKPKDNKEGEDSGVKSPSSAAPQQPKTPQLTKATDASSVIQDRAGQAVSVAGKGVGGAASAAQAGVGGAAGAAQAGAGSVLSGAKGLGGGLFGGKK